MALNGRLKNRRIIPSKTFRMVTRPPEWLTPVTADSTQLSRSSELYPGQDSWRPLIPALIPKYNQSLSSRTLAPSTVQKS